VIDVSWLLLWHWRWRWRWHWHWHWLDFRQLGETPPLPTSDFRLPAPVSQLPAPDFQLPAPSSPCHLNQKVTFAKKNSIMFSTEGKKLLAERLEALRRYL